jgi:hypothetical protein
MVDNKRALFGMKPPIDGDSAIPGPEAGKHGFQHLRAIILKQGHVIPLPHPQMIQGICQSIDPGVELGIPACLPITKKKSISRLSGPTMVLEELFTNYTKQIMKGQTLRGR